ncbi:MAG: M3 family metallopeptidase [Alphaproteobacteria bacterium]|nr:M3 family metallopeptidase [Alphaproteobacteria bacterium]
MVENSKKSSSKLALFLGASVVLGGVYFFNENVISEKGLDSMTLEKARWNLKDFGYSSYEDPQIEKDVLKIEEMTKDLLQYRGKVADNLEEILNKEIAISQLENKVFGYLGLLSSQDETNQELKKLEMDYSVRLSQLGAETEFINLEIGVISPEKYEELLKSSDMIKFHKPMLDKVIENAKYNLEESVEKILTKTSGFNSSPWGQAMSELEVRIRFDFEGEKLPMVKIIDILNNDIDPERREKALEVFSNTLADKGNSFSFVEMEAKTMNNIMGLATIMRKERGLTYPMEGRNIANMLDKKIVDSLHDVAAKEGKEQAMRYYKILAKLMDKDVLSWADRNAKPLQTKQEIIEWKDAVKMTVDSYSAFSPKLGKMAEGFFVNEKVDAPAYEGKNGGAFSYSFMLPDNVEQSYVLMNYKGKDRDVSTLAHEIGHSLHGILAERKQGELMHNAPMPYAETASIFGEMLLFDNLIKSENDKKKKLAMLLDKSNDWLNSVLRQISFSEFEIMIHDAREKGELLMEDFNNMYLDATKKYYGEDGEMFDYKHVAPLWSYVHHFRRPFYVYAYAFGELYTQSLFAVKDNFKEGEFEQLYIEMLEKGGTQGAVDLMSPFGLDPRSRDFWVNGVNVSIKQWLDEAEELMKELNL